MLHEFLDKTYRQSANKQESQEARFARTMQVFESIVGFLQDPLEFPNSKITDLIGAMYPAHGRYPLGIKIQEDRKGRMSLNIHQNPYGIRTISKIVIPEDLIECTQQDLIDTMGQIVYAASIGRDILQYSVSDYRDLETAQIRAFAHQAELFHTLNVMAETEQFSLSFNELQQTVMGLYPAGVMSLSPELQPRIIPDLLKRPNVTLN